MLDVKRIKGPQCSRPREIKKKTKIRKWKNKNNYESKKCVQLLFFSSSTAAAEICMLAVTEWPARNRLRAGRYALQSYLLGLLAKIKCSICSYQLNLWYVAHGVT